MMRADIARVCILHHYGGLYADLDVYPNRKSFSQVPFAIKNAYSCGFKFRFDWDERHSHRKRRRVYYKPCAIDMEVLIATRYNPALMSWLKFMRKQLQDRRYTEGSVWAKRRIRYIHSTTGPQCLQRFLRLPSNKELLKTLKYIQSNNLLMQANFPDRKRLASM